MANDLMNMTAFYLFGKPKFARHNNPYATPLNTLILNGTKIVLLWFPYRLGGPGLLLPEKRNCARKSTLSYEKFNILPRFARQPARSSTGSVSLPTQVPFAGKKDCARISTLNRNG
jgi:hypothetical protein